MLMNIERVLMLITCESQMSSMSMERVREELKEAIAWASPSSRPDSESRAGSDSLPLTLVATYGQRYV